MNFNNYTGTDVGQKRKANEDFHGDRMTVNGYIFVVCDGMGGHVGGATASQLAVESILEFFDKEPLDNIILGIDKAIKFANEQIFATALAQPELKGMGTTATITVMREEGAYIGHVGDSRIYLKSDGKLNRLTKDHSFVQGLVDQGIIKDEEAENHPQKNQILRALGIREDVDATVCDSPIQLKVGDTILMCSDGLSGLVKDSRMEDLLNENNVQQSVVGLINEANQNGGDDNITAAVISITESPYTVSVFKHFNPIAYMSTATIGLSEEPIALKWYQNTKLMLIIGGSALVLITFLLFMLWPKSTPPPSGQSGPIVQEVAVDSTDTKKILLSIDSLKKLDNVTLQSSNQNLEDGTYKSIDEWSFDIKSGLIDTSSIQSLSKINGGDSENIGKDDKYENARSRKKIEQNQSKTDKVKKKEKEEEEGKKGDEEMTIQQYIEQGFYTVLKNDNLGIISEKFKIKQDSLELWNDIKDPKKDVKLGGKIFLKNPKLK